MDVKCKNLLTWAGRVVWRHFRSWIRENFYLAVGTRLIGVLSEWKWPMGIVRPAFKTICIISWFDVRRFFNVHKLKAELLVFSVSLIKKMKRAVIWGKMYDLKFYRHFCSPFYWLEKMYNRFIRILRQKQEPPFLFGGMA